MEITEPGEVIYDDTQSGERIVYKYYVDGNVMKLRRTGEDTLHECIIEEVNETQIVFNTYPVIRECPIAQSLYYLTKTD